MRHLTAEERETSIGFDDSTQVANIYTANTALRRKLDKLCKEYPEVYKLEESNDFSSLYTCNKKLIKFGKPRRVSEESRKARSEHMKNYHLNKQNNKE